MHVSSPGGGQGFRHKQQRVTRQERRDDHAGFEENDEKETA